jgi:hypothetical protein
MSKRLVFQIYLLGSVFVTGVVCHLDYLGIKALLLVVAALVLDLSFQKTLTGNLKLSPAFLGWKGTEWAILIFSMAPAVTFLISGWSQEFPFAGDSSYHIHASIAFSSFVQRVLNLNPVVLLLLLCFSGIALVIFQKWILPLKFSTTIICIVLFVASYKIDLAHYLLARYPSTFYVLSIPFTLLAKFQAWDSYLNALKITNVLSIAGWLILRAIFLKRKPDLVVAAVAAVFLWQKYSVFYFASAYLEPWSLVFLLLAIESLVGSEEIRWQSLIWLGMASLTKEPPVILYPIFFLCLMLSMGRERKTLLSLAYLSFLSVVPVVLYHLYRSQTGVNRKFIPRELGQLWSAEYFQFYFQQMHLHFDLYGFILIAFLLGMAARGLFRRNKDNLPESLPSLAMLAAFLLFFYFDKASESVAGLPRFQLFPFLLLSTTLFSNRNKQPLTLVLAGLVLNLPGTFSLVKAAHANGYELNYFENYDTPILFPIRKLVEKASPPEGANIDLVHFHLDTADFSLAYPSLNTRFHFSGLDGNSSPKACACGTEKLVLVVFESQINLRKRRGSHPTLREHLERWQETSNHRRACIENLKKTCSRSYQVEDSAQDLWGIIGSN